MGQPIPKQYLDLCGKAIIDYSIEAFLQVQEITQLVIVCAPEFRHLLDTTTADIPIAFALPGPRRQDSAFNGLKAVTETVELVATHDASRPLVTPEIIRSVLSAAVEFGAAILGRPVPFTVKQATTDGFVDKTLDRSLVWEIQTPQVARSEILREGYAIANSNDADVTDCASIMKLTGHSVKLVPCSGENMKITTSEDLTTAMALLEQRLSPQLA